MKLHKNFFAFLATAFVALLVAASAHAQSPGVYTILNGGTNNVPASGVSSTNTTTAFAVSEFDNLGLQITMACGSALSSNIVVQGFRSLDSTSYETTPSVNFAIVLNGTTAVTTVTNISVPSAGTYQLRVINTNAVGAVTNLSIVRRLKAPKYTRN